MNFIESMRRRWEVLGIDIQEQQMTGSNNKGKEREVVGDETESTDVPMQVDGDDESEEARRAIMQGALVKSAIDSAVKGKFVKFLTYTSR